MAKINILDLDPAAKAIARVKERNTCMLPAVRGEWEVRIGEKSSKEIRDIVTDLVVDCRTGKDNEKLCPVCGYCPRHCLEHSLRVV